MEVSISIAGREGNINCTFYIDDEGRRTANEYLKEAGIPREHFWNTRISGQTDKVIIQSGEVVVDKSIAQEIYNLRDRIADLEALLTNEQEFSEFCSRQMTSIQIDNLRLLDRIRHEATRTGSGAL